MANNLRKFNTYSDYEAAELVKPAVSLIADTDEVYFDQKATFNGLTVYYNITDTSQPTKLFNVQSGSGSGSGGALPSAMIIDGTAVEVTNTYQFSSTGEHIVQYSIENAFKKLPNAFLDNTTTATKVIIGDYFEKIGYSAFTECSGLTRLNSDVDGVFNIPDSVTSIGDEAIQNCRKLTTCTIGSGITSIGEFAFFDCKSLTSVTVNAVTPPTLGDYAFDSTNNDLVIYVPCESVEAYKAAWSRYASRVQPIP